MSTNDHRSLTAVASLIIRPRLLHEVGGHLAKAELDWTENPVTAQTMADVLTHLLEQRVTGRPPFPGRHCSR